MIMNKKGFTLPELLGVIVVLSVIIGIAGMSVLSIMNKAVNKALEEMKDNLKDAALTCYLDTKDTDKCNTPEKLKASNYFEDDKGYCLDKNITISFDSNNDDYTASVNGNCSK